MKVTYLIALILAVLVAAACSSKMATPTPEAEIGATEEATAVVASDTATPVVGQATTAPSALVGAVEVALTAIEPVEGVLATVNGEEITWADFEPELNHSLHSVTLQYEVDWSQAENIDLLPSFQDEVLQTVIDRAVLRQGAATEGIEASEEAVEARVEEQKAAILVSGLFSSWEHFLELYGLSEEYFARLMADDVLVDLVSKAYAPSREAEQVHARHILVSDEEAGKAVIARLEAGEEWAALASELSQDTSNKDKEGDLGWFARGVMVPEFEEAAFSLKPGTTSDVVHTDYGYHVIQVLEKGVRELDAETYDAVVTRAFQTWLDAQRAAAETTIAVNFASPE